MKKGTGKAQNVVKGYFPDFRNFKANFKYMILIQNFFFRDPETPPSLFSKNVSVLSHPRQNPLLVCIVPKI